MKEKNNILIEHNFITTALKLRVIELNSIISPPAQIIALSYGSENNFTLKCKILCSEIIKKGKKVKPLVSLLYKYPVIMPSVSKSQHHTKRVLFNYSIPL